MKDILQDQLAQDAAMAKAAGLSYGKYKALQHEKAERAIGVPVRRSIETVPCVICGKSIPTKGNRRKYCSPACADIAHQEQLRKKQESRRKK